jgi:hypothetical protein
MSAEQLNALQGAAKLAGVSSEALTAGMTNLGDTLVDAVGGRAPEAVRMLNTLGISFRNADGSARKATDVLPELADKIASIRNPTLQARAATALFGGAAEAMLPFLRKGSAGIREYTEMAQHYGVMNDEATRAADDLRMAQTRLSLSVTGLGNSISQQLAPVLGPMLIQLAEWINNNRELISQEVAAIIKQLGDAIKNIDWKEVGKSIKDIATDVNNIVQAFGGWKVAAEGVAVYMAGAWLTKMTSPLMAVAKIMAAMGLLTPAALAALGIAAETKAGEAYDREIDKALPGASEEEKAQLKAAARTGAPAMTSGTPEAPGPWGKLEKYLPSWVPGASKTPPEQAPTMSGAPGANPNLPRGMRNNNPLNLTYLPGQGAIGHDSRFGVFRTMEEGIAANYKQMLINRDRHGLVTLAQQISRWAPPGENNTAAYIARVAKETGLDPNAPLNLDDPDTAARVIRAMSHVENAGMAPSAEQARRGVQLAFGVPQPSAPPSAPTVASTTPPTPPAPEQPKPAGMVSPPRPPPAPARGPTATPPPAAPAQPQVAALAPPAPPAPVQAQAPAANVGAGTGAKPEQVEHTVRGSADVTVRIQGAPAGTQTIAQTSGDLFNPPKVEMAMTGTGP